MSLFQRKEEESGGPSVNVRVSHVEQLEESGVYRAPRPYTDDPTQQNMGLFHNPDNHKTMANLSPADAFDLSILDTIGTIGRNPILRLLAKNQALYSRSRNGFGSIQMADILRRTPQPEATSRRLGGLFGRRKPDE